MAGNRERKVLKIILQTLALLLILLILPIGSWYYLKNGLDYRVAAMGDLKKYGQLPAFSYLTFSGTTVDTSVTNGKMLITNLLNLQDQQMAQIFGTTLEKLHRQFNEREDLLFLIYVPDSTATKESVEAFAKQHKLEDIEQFFFIPMSTDSIQHIQQQYFMPADAALPYLTLSDVKGMVRHYYDVRKTEDLKKLVAQTALLLPIEKSKEITLKPENEK